MFGTPLLAPKPTPGGFDSSPRRQKVRRMMSETYVLTREQLETVLRSTYAAGEQAGESPLSAARAERRFRRAIDAEVERASEYTARNQ